MFPWAFFLFHNINALNKYSLRFSFWMGVKLPCDQLQSVGVGQHTSQGCCVLQESHLEVRDFGDINVDHLTKMLFP